MRPALGRSFHVSADTGLRPTAKVLAPVLMRSQGMRCAYTAAPTVLRTGVATTGTIQRMLFFFGRTPEQALLVNVKRRGLVLIVGCGHQGVPRLLARAEALIDAPLYGIVGGLHLPVHGLIAQDILGSSRWPWQRTQERDVTKAIDELRRRRPNLVALSPHDSSPWALATLADAFGDRYQTIRVGEEIRITEADRAPRPLADTSRAQPIVADPSP